jgi:pilus assembly protein CpaC
MPSSNLRDVMRNGALAAIAALMMSAIALGAEVRERVRIPVGHGDVIQSTEDVRTVAIAEPTIADAAVGSARTVVVNAKSVGTTSLVVYNEGGKYKIYDIEVYTPNGDKQVLLHVQVAELTNTALRELGLDVTGSGRTNTPWIDGALQGGLYTGQLGPQLPISGPSAVADGILKYAKNDGRLTLQAQWRALETRGDIRTLAHPSLLAKSGEKASFLVGGEIPYTTQTFVSGTSAQSVAFREFGVKLNFTPVVEDNGIIHLNVAPEVSELDPTIQVLGVPGLRIRKASTVVDMNPGEYLTIGGLTQTSKTKVRRRVPLLGQIPLIGLLFTSTHMDSQDRELLVVVYPELVSPSSTMPQLPTDKPEAK